MRKAKKTLEEYQIEINDLEIDSYQTSDEKYLIKGEGGVQLMFKSSEEKVSKIMGLRYECIAYYGSTSLWPIHETPGLIGEFIVAGILKVKNISPWFESQLNMFKAGV